MQLVQVRASKHADSLKQGGEKGGGSRGEPITVRSRKQSGCAFNLFVDWRGEKKRKGRVGKRVKRSPMLLNHNSSISSRPVCFKEKRKKKKKGGGWKRVVDLGIDAVNGRAQCMKQQEKEGGRGAMLTTTSRSSYPLPFFLKKKKGKREKEGKKEGERERSARIWNAAASVTFISHQCAAAIVDYERKRRGGREEREERREGRRKVEVVKEKPYGFLANVI